MTPADTTEHAPVDLRQQAADLNSQAAAIQQQLEQEALEEYRRTVDAQRVWDERFVANYSRKAHDAEVDQARAAFDQALANNPLVLAFADYLTALRRRRYGAYEQNAALQRLGRAGSGNFDPPRAEVHVLDELVSAVERVTTARTTAENEALHASRENAGTTKETDR